jgi:hypothetical protein
MIPIDSTKIIKQKIHQKIIPNVAQSNAIINQLTTIYVYIVYIDRYTLQWYTQLKAGNIEITQSESTKY